MHRLNAGHGFIFILAVVFAHGKPLFAGVPSGESVVVPKLREFCQSCHAVGDVRFIRSADDHVVWVELFKGKAPKSGKVWADAIVDVLSWPSNDPPDFESPIEPGRDWMPKGSKRLALATDTVNGELTRHMLLRELRRGVAADGREGFYPRCAPSPKLVDPALGLRKGYMDFFNPAELASVKELLPVLSDATLDQVMRGAETMWYDEETMAFSYQDSEETVTGVRANCVGREVGERNADNPGIFKLTKYFGADYRFREPFRKAAGTNDVENVKVVNFWLPPRDKDGNVIPVRYWKTGSRSRWRWAFPVDTVFGEVLMQRDSAGKLHVFEVRTRKRYLQGWAVNMFRPFRTAQEMAVAVRSLRPNWLIDPNLVQLVQHLDDPGTLRSHSMKSVPFGRIFPEIKGAIDEIPAIADEGLVKALLHRKFVSVEGSVWKENPGLLTYAPGSAGEFSIVPRGYEMGLIPVNDESCTRCHNETGRRLGQIEGDIVLYGEVWGEDQIFTWHLFEPNRKIFDAYDESDGSRIVNPRMVQAGLVSEGQPDAGSKVWRALPSAYDKAAP
jgi:hypothetical protein